MSSSETAWMKETSEVDGACICGKYATHFLIPVTENAKFIPSMMQGAFHPRTKAPFESCSEYPPHRFLLYVHPTQDITQNVPSAQNKNKNDKSSTNCFRSTASTLDHTD
ncbi:hypothetical protein BZA77DRAFT_295228 [Pyronema omphalodes]|nr:hypothetical protein BZA77DRAFT_295228 [Pyronema omphalodes]